MIVALGDFMPRRRRADGPFARLEWEKAAELSGSTRSVQIENRSDADDGVAQSGILQRGAQALTQADVIERAFDDDRELDALRSLTDLVVHHLGVFTMTARMVSGWMLVAP